MKIQAHRCTWDGDPGWMQYHDKTDPMPKKWDDEPPDEVVALVLKIDADHEIDRLRAALRISTNGLRHCAGWNISEEKARALMAVVMENEAILGTEAPNA